MSAESAQRVGGVEHVLQCFPDFVQAVQRVGASWYPAVVVLDLLLCRFQFQSLFFYEVANHPQFFYIGGCVEPYSFFIAFWVDDCEFAFPEAQCGGGQADYFGYLLYLVVFFVQVVHVCKNSKKIVILRLDTWKSSRLFFLSWKSSWRKSQEDFMQ